MIARRRICFLPETLVSTPQGDRAIGDLEAGDLVHAYDFEAGQWVEREVEARHDNTTDGKIYQILIGDERIGATPKHPFWVVEGASLGDRSIPPELKAGEDEGQKLSGRWVRADELQVGDVVYQRDGSHSAIQSIDIEEVDGQRVCNLTIHELHNYAVGKLATLVHNGTGCERGVDAPKGIKNVPGDDFVPGTNVSTKYKRPSGAGPTAAQRRAVQGKPCVDCGKVTPKQVADHKDPLVVQHYREGAVDTGAQSALDAVQPHCPPCSAKQGGLLSGFSRRMKKLLGL